MGNWLFLRLGRALLAAWAIASLVFLVSRLGPAGAAQQSLDQADALDRHLVAGGSATQAAVTRRLGLDAPLFYVGRGTGPAGQWQWHGTHNQYHYWLKSLAHGDLGRSYRNDQPVAAQLGPALGYTVPLVGLALALAVGLALVLATHLAAGRPGSLGRQAVAALLTGLQALPLFVLALLLLWLLANPALLNILPAEDLDADLAAAPTLGELPGYLLRLLLPVLALVLAALPELTLPLAAALRQELASPYAVAARAKGLSIRQLIWRHALPLAVLPLLAALSELVPALVAGTVVVETLFARPGMGRLLADAAATHDYPVLVAGVLLVAGARLLALLLADLVHYRLDPRLRTTLL